MPRGFAPLSTWIGWPHLYRMPAARRCYRPGLAGPGVGWDSGSGV